MVVDELLDERQQVGDSVEEAAELVPASGAAKVVKVELPVVAEEIGDAGGLALVEALVIAAAQAPDLLDIRELLDPRLEDADPLFHVLCHLHSSFSHGPCAARGCFPA